MELKCSDDLRKLILDMCYPIGHVWVSMNGTNPKDIVGGTWVQIKGRYLCAIDPNTTMDHNTVKKQFGSWDSENIILTVDQMPQHTHFFWFSSISNQYSSEPLRGNGASFAIDEGNSVVANWCNGDQKHDGYVSNNGSNKGHKHIVVPPSIGVYAWYRTA